MECPSDTIETNLDTLGVSPCGWFGLDRDFLCKIDAFSDIHLDSQSMIKQDTLYLHSALSTWHEAVAEAEPSQCRQKMSSKRDFFELSKPRWRKILSKITDLSSYQALPRLRRCFHPIYLKKEEIQR